jgi:hypothetical protein
VEPAMVMMMETKIMMIMMMVMKRLKSKADENKNKMSIAGKQKTKQSGECERSQTSLDFRMEVVFKMAELNSKEEQNLYLSRVNVKRKNGLVYMNNRFEMRTKVLSLIQISAQFFEFQWCCFIFKSQRSILYAAPRRTGQVGGQI